MVRRRTVLIRRLGLAVVAVAMLAVAMLAANSSASAAGPTVIGGTPKTIEASPLTAFSAQPRSLRETPRGFAINGLRARDIARFHPAVIAAKQSHPDLRLYVHESAEPLASGSFLHWQVVAGAHNHDLVEIDIAPNGQILEVWENEASIDWDPLGRGYPGLLGWKVNAPWIWLPLCLLFVAPFLDLRRPKRLLHLDLIALLSFSVSYYYYLRADLGASGKLIAPPLLYVAVRCGWAALSRRRTRSPLIPHAGKRVLAVLLLLLIVGRLWIVFDSPDYLDAAHAAMIGAARIEHGQQLYVDNSVHGDTYGPFLYLAYVPFHEALGYDQNARRLPAVDVATAVFDLLTLAGLFMLGRQLARRSDRTTMGLALAYAWAAFPFSFLPLTQRTNEPLLTALLVWCFVLARRPALRGLMLGLAIASKFVPALIGPALVDTPDGRRGKHDALIFIGSGALVSLGLIALFLPDGGVREFWNTTLGFQIGRTSPFGLWGFPHPAKTVQTIVSAVVIVLGLLALRWPRQRTLTQALAVSAGLLAAQQLGSGYWMYFYIAWFAPLALAAWFGEHDVVVDPNRSGQGRNVTRLRSKSVSVSG